MTEARAYYEDNGGCSCHISPPCAFCTAMNEEECDIYANDGVDGLLEYWNKIETTLKSRLNLCGRCTCAGDDRCAWCNLPCGTCLKKRWFCECDDATAECTLDEARLTWMKDGIIAVAEDPNLGLLIFLWQLRQDRIDKTLDLDAPRPALLTVIQRWLRAGCPADPLELLELIRLGDGDRGQ